MLERITPEEELPVEELKEEALNEVSGGFIRSYVGGGIGGAVGGAVGGGIGGATGGSVGGSVVTCPKCGREVLKSQLTSGGCLICNSVVRKNPM